MLTALPCMTGMPCRWLRWETRLLRLAAPVPPSARPSPARRDPAPKAAPAPAPGRHTSPTPATPRMTPAKAFRAMGVPKKTRAPRRLRMASSEKITAMRPEGIRCSARYTQT